MKSCYFFFFFFFFFWLFSTRSPTRRLNLYCAVRFILDFTKGKLQHKKKSHCHARYNDTMSSTLAKNGTKYSCMERNSKTENQKEER